MVNHKELKVNPENLKTHVQKLTSLNPARNSESLNSLNEAADYIHKHFQSYCLNTHFQEYKVDGKTYKNVICSFGAEKSPLIVVGAHYDVAGEMPGADDNASGVAGLIELARLIQEQKPNLKNKIELVAYSLEEPPYFSTGQMGSAVHAKSLRTANKELKLMISLEMIGYFTDEPDSQRFPVEAMKFIYPNTGNFVAVVGRLEETKTAQEFKNKMLTSTKIPVKTVNAPSSLSGISLSDHSNYWKEVYRAIMVTDTAFYRNPNYHQPTDTPETLNYEKMAEVVKGVYTAIID